MASRNVGSAFGGGASRGNRGNVTLNRRTTSSRGSSRSRGLVVEEAFLTDEGKISTRPVTVANEQEKAVVIEKNRALQEEQSLQARKTESVRQLTERQQVSRGDFQSKTGEVYNIQYGSEVQSRATKQELEAPFKPRKGVATIGPAPVGPQERLSEAEQRRIRRKGFVKDIGTGFKEVYDKPFTTAVRGPEGTLSRTSPTLGKDIGRSLGVVTILPASYYAGVGGGYVTGAAKVGSTALIGARATKVVGAGLSTAGAVSVPLSIYLAPKSERADVTTKAAIIGVGGIAGFREGRRTFTQQYTKRSLLRGIEADKRLFNTDVRIATGYRARRLVATREQPLAFPTRASMGEGATEYSPRFLSAPAKETQLSLAWKGRPITQPAISQYQQGIRGYDRPEPAQAKSIQDALSRTYGPVKGFTQSTLKPLFKPQIIRVSERLTAEYALGNEPLTQRNIYNILSGRQASSSLTTFGPASVGYRLPASPSATLKNAVSPLTTVGRRFSSVPKAFFVFSPFSGIKQASSVSSVSSQVVSSSYEVIPRNYYSTGQTPIRINIVKPVSLPRTDIVKKPVIKEKELLSPVSVSSSTYVTPPITPPTVPATPSEPAIDKPDIPFIPKFSFGDGGRKRSRPIAFKKFSSKFSTSFSAVQLGKFTNKGASKGYTGFEIRGG
jgi:hypothetical protein